MGEYKSTVIGRRFVVQLRHCHRRSRCAVWGCVGKIRATHLCAVVLSFWHAADTLRQASSFGNETHRIVPVEVLNRLRSSKKCPCFTFVSKNAAAL